MTTDRWNPSFLDTLRSEGDPDADEALRRIMGDNEAASIRTLFAVMDSNDEVPPSAHFPVLSEFFKASETLPPDVDLARLHRGEDVFIDHTYAGALALLAKSLPEGYQAPNLSIILNISGDLRTHTYRRLLATLQTVVNVSTCRGFTAGGRAVITAQKLRLLHAGIRHLVPRARPEYRGAYGVPVNQEDMLATIMGFSLLVIEGWRVLGAGLTRRQEEDFLYLWIVFARMMGIHPAGEPHSAAYVPAGLDEATTFYRLYEQRHYVDGSRNPDGVALAGANLAMLRRLIPRPLRWLGFGALPGICMGDMMGEEACRRLGIPPVAGHHILKFLLLNLHRLFHPRAGNHTSDHERFGMILFRYLIDRSYGGEVTFTVPTDVSQLKTMVDPVRGPAGPGPPSIHTA
jgi:hypothetical protein